MTAMLKLFRSAVLPAAALLMTACGGSMSGLDLSMITASASDDAAAPAGQPQLTVLSPEETPPVPSRRPGKRPRGGPALAAQPASTASAPAQTASAEPAKAEAEKSDGFSLASLGNVFTSAPGEGPDSILMDKPPVEAYSLLAQRIKYCWLNPSAPRLGNHGFHAEMAPGEIREAKMVVYEKAPDGRRGTTAYKIDITTESSGSLVSTRNARLNKAEETAFKADLARWAKGDDRCKV
jgi:hypothetical protein